MTIEEREDLGQIGRLLRVRRHVPPQRQAEARIARPARGFRAGRRGGAGARDVRAVFAGDHALRHGRTAGRRCQRHHAGPAVWHTRAVGLGRTTRFAPLPAGARRVSVMRAGAAGIKVLAPSDDLLAEFQARKRELVRGGAASDGRPCLGARGDGLPRAIPRRDPGETGRARRPPPAHCRGPRRRRLSHVHVPVPDSGTRVPHLRAPRSRPRARPRDDGAPRTNPTEGQARVSRLPTSRRPRRLDSPVMRGQGLSTHAAQGHHSRSFWNV